MKKSLMLIILLTTQCLIAQNIVINEILASNNTTIYDEDGDASDWIELYKNGSIPINLEGYFLSDDSLNIEKWQFSNVVINPGEYLLVFASDNDTTMNYSHTNFKISASGEHTLTITYREDGAKIDKLCISNYFESPNGMGEEAENLRDLTEVKKKSKIPNKYGLEQNYSDPFNPETVINYNLSDQGLINLKVYNVTGKEIIQLVNEEKSAHAYSVICDDGKFTSGNYFYTISAGNFIQTKKNDINKING
ncbi:MAG: lamin tail domain-containing protein [Ignavibacteriales bacterium]|nr:lamin tail domain-containing protein [Ignavibacteriales bacterium]